MWTDKEKLRSFVARQIKTDFRVMCTEETELYGKTVKQKIWSLVDIQNKERLYPNQCDAH